MGALSTWFVKQKILHLLWNKLAFCVKRTNVMNTTKVSQLNTYKMLALWSWFVEQKDFSLGEHKICFFKWANPGLFYVLFSFFSCYNLNTNWKSIDGVLGIRTRGLRMVGADETTELWRPPKSTRSVDLRPASLFPSSCIITASSARNTKYENQTSLAGEKVNTWRS